MWDRLLEIGKQVLSLKNQVSNNTSSLGVLRSDFNRFIEKARGLVGKIKLMEQRHELELKRIEESHKAEIRRLEDRIDQLEKRYILSLEHSKAVIENQFFRAIHQSHNPILLSESDIDIDGKTSNIKP